MGFQALREARIGLTARVSFNLPSAILLMRQAVVLPHENLSPLPGQSLLLGGYPPRDFLLLQPGRAPRADHESLPACEGQERTQNRLDH